MFLVKRLWRRLMGREPNPTEIFHSLRGELLRQWFEHTSGAGKPRGLCWATFELAGETVFGRIQDQTLALVPLVVQFEPLPGGELAEVSQAWEPRTVVAVFVYRRGRWQTEGRAVFNLTPAELLQRGRTP